ncbi:hypothetical protein Barb7_02790 [Bacteroidales bacterium Barb7]|nr:hypothetical protein Barb7_02790 [Bacteroidales bacterium Barb7]
MSLQGNPMKSRILSGYPHGASTRDAPTVKSPAPSGLHAVNSRHSWKNSPLYSAIPKKGGVCLQESIRDCTFAAVQTDF